MNYKNVKIAEGARIAKQSVILGDVTVSYTHLTLPTKA